MINSLEKRGPGRATRMRTIGTTGVEVTQLGFGCTAIGEMFGAVPPEVAEGALRAAHAGGLKYFDTAPFYGLGEAERRFGRSVRAGHLPSVTLSTKVGRWLRWTPDRAPATANGVARVMPWFDYSADGIRRSFDETVQRTGIDTFDIIYIHDLSSRWHGDSLQQRMIEVAEHTIPVLRDLQERGHIRAIGIGTNDPASCRQFIDMAQLDVIMLAGCYTLLNQSGFSELLPACAERGIAVVSAAPFNSGILATGAQERATYFYSTAPAEIMERTRRIEAVCARYDVPLPAAALQFALGHPALVSVVAGMASTTEVEANIALMNHSVPGDFWRDLVSEGLLVEGTPLPEGGE